MIRARIGLALTGLALATGVAVLRPRAVQAITKTRATGLSPRAARIITPQQAQCAKLHSLYLEAVGNAYNEGATGDMESAKWWMDIAAKTASIIDVHC